MTSKVDCFATQLVAQNRGLGRSLDIGQNYEQTVKKLITLVVNIAQ